MFSGSKAILMPFCRPIEVDPRARCMYGRFNVPTPCSPDRVPPRSSAISNSSATICSTLAHCSGSRLSNRILGCRLPSPACPKMTMGSPYLALTSFKRRTASGMALRGTVMSSPSLLGERRARAGATERRAFHKAARSASSLATVTLRAPCRRQISAAASISRVTVCLFLPIGFDQ